MLNDPMSLGNPKKFSSKTSTVLGVILIIVILSALVYWFITRPGSLSRKDESPVEYKNAEKVEMVKAQSPLYGIVESIEGDIVTVKELQMPTPGIPQDKNAKAGNTYMLKITNTTLLSSGSPQDKPASTADIKKNDYIITSPLDTSLSQPIEITSIQYSASKPF